MPLAPRPVMRIIPAACVLFALSLGAARAEAEDPLPDPFHLEDAVRWARRHRAEIRVAKQRAAAAAERPAIVSSLEDPLLMTSLDHLPFKQKDMPGADFSVVVEQSFPLSGVLGARRRAAEHDARRYLALADRTMLDVEIDAATAYLMLYQLRASARVLQEQSDLAQIMRDTANARLAGGSGTMAEVLRADEALAQAKAEIEVNRAEQTGAEAMLNAALNRGSEEPIPRLDITPDTAPSTAAFALFPLARAQRPELAAARAEIARSRAEIDVMKSMYGPMAFVRVGGAYTMTEGAGVMAMVGVSLPIYVGKRRAGVRETQAMAAMADADADAMTRMVESEVASTRAQVEGQRVRYLATRDEVLPRAKAAGDAALAAFAAGNLPLVSVLEALDALEQAKLQQIRSAAELALARAKLERAVGDTHRE